MKQMNFYYRAIMAFLLLLAVQTQAANFDFVSGDSGTLMRHATPNAAGVSINKMNSLTVSAAAGLKLVNASSLNANLTNTGEANVILLQATSATQSINLQGLIEVIGQPADVVLLAPKFSEIICNGCLFKNTPRVVIATGEVSFNSNGAINQITSTDGLIDITSKGLDAAGVQFVDLLSQNIHLSGTLNTNLKARRDQQGKVVIDNQATQTLGAGRVQILLGNNRYQYNSSIATSLGSNPHTQWISNPSSRISTGELLIASTSNVGTLTINGSINTQSDFTLAGIYQGITAIPSKTITLSTTSALQLNGSINSQQSINIHTEKTLINQGTVAGTEIKAVVIGSLTNTGTLQAKQNMALAAADITNTGTINAAQDMFISAEQGITNPLGGTFTAHAMRLEAPNGMITNGSTDSNTGTAVIHANDIDINAKQVVNKNNYLEANLPDWRFWVDKSLDEVKSNAVLIRADNTLRIISSTAIDNQSAILSAGELLVLDAPIINNQRTQLQVTSSPGTQHRKSLCVEFQGCLLPHNVKVSTAITDQTIVSLAPPARLLSEGKGTLKAKQFNNEYSFLEIYNNLSVNVDQVVQKGLQLVQTIDVKKTTTTEEKKRPKPWKSHRTYIKETYSNSNHVDPTAEVPSLIAVGGVLEGTGANQFSVEQNTLD